VLGPGEWGWTKVKNRGYWRCPLEREAAIRSRQRLTVGWSSSMRTIRPASMLVTSACRTRWLELEFHSHAAVMLRPLLAGDTERSVGEVIASAAAS
jgi:hypothetical protein